MINLNFSTVEELIFYDTSVQSRLPAHMFSLFEQWRLAKRVPYLREIGKQALLDFLNTITDKDVATLEEYFGDKIVVEKLNYNIVLNIKVPLSEADVCNSLCDVEGFNYLSTWRDDEHLYVVLWR